MMEETSDQQLEDEYSNREQLKSLAPAIYANSHVLEKLVEDLKQQNEALLQENRYLKESNETSDEIVERNNWTPTNTETVKKWQRDIEHTSFIYGEVLLGVKTKLKLFLITTLLLTTLSALFSALSVTLTFLGQKWVGVTFEILILLSSAGAAVLTGLIPILSLETKLEDFTRFTEKLDNAWFVFEVELGISPDQRINAHDFIKRYDGHYLSLMQQCPFLDVEEYQKANFSYKERLYQNSAWSKNVIKSVIVE